MMFSGESSTVCMLRIGLGSVIIGVYSIRNFKHLRNMRKRFVIMGQASPGIWRSSMTRQQMQLYLGLGVGGAVC